MAVAAGICAALGGAYFLIQDYEKSQFRKQVKSREREALKLLQQIKQDRDAIERDLEQLVVQQQQAEPDRKRCEYALAQCDELLLRLLERLDAIQPSAIVITDDGQPTALDTPVVEEIRRRKKKLIQRIQLDHARVDQYRLALLAAQ